MAAVPTVVYFLLVLRHMTYAWDDFIQFGVTMQTGLSRDLLTYSLFEHFAPLNRAVHGILVTAGGLDPRWAIVVALPVFFAYCLALTDLARLLGASWAKTALCLAVATVTPATAFIGAFLDPYFHVMVPVAATAVATAAYIRWVRTGRFVHIATAAVVYAIACAVQERGIFIVLFLALARVLVIEGGEAPRRWLRTLLHDWPFLVVPVALAAATAAVVSLFYAADSQRGGVLETVSLVAQSWTRRLVPMVTGLYGHGPDRLEIALTVLANLVVLGLFVWTVRSTTWNLRPWLLLVVWFGFNMTFVGFGRLGVAPLATFRDDPNYYTYAMPAVVLLISSLRPGPRRAAEAARPEQRRRTTVAMLVAAAVLGSLVVVSALPQARRHEVLRPDYLAGSVDSLRAATAEGPTVVAPTLAPGGLVPGPFFPYNSGEFVLKEIDARTAVDVDPERPRFLNMYGYLSDASAQLLARVEPTSPVAAWALDGATGGLEGDSYCLSAEGAGHLAASLSTPARSPGGAAWVRLITQGESTYGSIATTDGDSWVQSAPGPLTADRGSVSFMVPAGEVSQVDLLDVRASRLCIKAIEIWALSAEGAEGCGWVGSGGEIVAAREPEAPLRCPGD